MIEEDATEALPERGEPSTESSVAVYESHRQTESNLQANKNFRSEQEV